MRLRKLEDQVAQKLARGNDRNILADFMSNGINDVRKWSRNNPTPFI